MVPEARLEQTEHGLVPSGDGWFVLNARDARWFDRGPRGVVGVFEGEPEFDQLGVNQRVHFRDDSRRLSASRRVCLTLDEIEKSRAHVARRNDELTVRALAREPARIRRQTPVRI